MLRGPINCTRNTFCEFSIARHLNQVKSLQVLWPTNMTHG